MNFQKGSLVAIALLIAACAPRLSSTLGDATPLRDPVGEATVMIAPPDVARARATLRAKAEALMVSTAPFPAQLVFATDGSMRLRAGSDESFEPDSAQLRARALAFYSAVAQLLRDERSTVAHVLVHGDVATDADPSLDLSARRAASLHNVLLRAGAPAMRLRAEGRANREPVTGTAGATAANRRVELVFQPVVAGQEPLAWMPPAAVPCRCGE